MMYFADFLVFMLVLQCNAKYMIRPELFAIFSIRTLYFAGNNYHIARPTNYRELYSDGVTIVVGHAYMSMTHMFNVNACHMLI